MPTIKVNGTSNSLCHKASGWFAQSTLPDVCKTPSPGGPVPIPYPVIVSLSSDLANGSTTVKADGGNMIAIKGSEFSRCSGDEPGTAGGVKSSTNMKEATWILYSFDVKIDGKNACRLSDKMQMNHGNTMCLAGLDGISVDVHTAEIKDEICKEFCAELKKGKPFSSSKFEKRLNSMDKFKDKGVEFGKRFQQEIPKSLAQKVGRSTRNALAGGMVRITIIPDACLMIAGKVMQCFEIKFPGDRVGRGMKSCDQTFRQQQLTEGNRPTEMINKETCKCDQG